MNYPRLAIAGAVALLAAACSDGGPTAVSTSGLSAPSLHGAAVASQASKSLIVDRLNKKALTVDQANASGFTFDLGINAAGGIAQGFTPTANRLDAVDLFLTGTGSNPALSLTVNIRSGTFDGPVLGTTLVAVPADVTGTPSNPTVVQAVFATPVPLTPGSVYYIQVDPDGGFLGAAATSGDAYPGGGAYQGGSAAPAVDIGFRTYFSSRKVKPHRH